MRELTEQEVAWVAGGLAALPAGSVTVAKAAAPGGGATSSPGRFGDIVDVIRRLAPPIVPTIL